MARLTGKVAIVSGASKGIGAAVAEHLAAEGATVVVNYANSAPDADAVVSRIAAKGGRAKAVQGDMSKLSDIEKLVDGTVRDFGRLDILVNNAGIYEFAPLSEVDERHFDRQFGLNVRGLLFATKAAAKAFGERGGSIINVSSLVSVSPVAGGSVYSATKAAVDALTKSLAAELGPKKILVNSVLPGPVQTEGFRQMPGSGDLEARFVPQTPLGRIGQPSDVATVVSFLASEDAGWITGQVIPVAGGLRI